MSTDRRLFEWAVLAVAVAFSIFFVVVVFPPALGDPIGAIGDGFVNSSAAGYSTDVILCWVVLALWVTHDAKAHGIRGGWWCLILGIVPGVVVGLAAYHVIRGRQFEQAARAQLRSDP
jgi:hypothetical protein